MTILNKKILYAAGLLSTAHIPFLATTYADMSLKQVLKLTSETNPQILSDASSAKARENVIRQAEAGYLPKIDVSVSAGPERTREKIRPNSASGALDFGTTLYRRNPAVNLSQNVFDGFKTRSDVERATTDFIQGEKKVDETLEQISYRAAAAYIKVRRFQRLLREAERNLAAHKRVAGKVEQLIKGGRASTADRFTVAARIATAQNAIHDITGDLNDATAEFKSLVGLEPDRLVSAKIPDSYLPVCINDAVQVAREHNKSLLLARSSLDVALAELNVTEAAFYPKVTVEASAARAKNNAAEKARIDTYNVLGVVRYNLYNGGADSAKVSEIAEKIAQQRYLVDQQLRISEEETRKSWAAKISAAANSIEQRKAVVALREEKDAFEKQYEIGTRTLIDVLGAINEYFLARGALITSDSAQDTAEARLMAAMGVLTLRFDTARRTPELFSERGVPTLVNSYSNKNCEKKGDLPVATPDLGPEREDVLKTVAYEKTAQEETGFFGNWFTNLASTEPSSPDKTQTTSTPQPTPVEEKADEKAFFGEWMTNLASTTPSTSETTTAPAQKDQKEETSSSTAGSWLTNLFSSTNEKTSTDSNTTPLQQRVGKNLTK